MKKISSLQIGRIIKNIRGSLKVEEFIALVNVKQATLSRMENGQISRTLQSMLAFKRAANFGGMLLDELLAGGVTRIDRTKTQHFMLTKEFCKDWLPKTIQLSKDGEVLALIEPLAFDDDEVWDMKISELLQAQETTKPKKKKAGT